MPKIHPMSRLYAVGSMVEALHDGEMPTKEQLDDANDILAEVYCLFEAAYPDAPEGVKAKAHAKFEEFVSTDWDERHDYNDPMANMPQELDELLAMLGLKPEPDPEDN